MRARSSRLAAAVFSCLLLLTTLAACSCARSEPSYRVALVGFEAGDQGEERNDLAVYGQRRVEAELGVEVDFVLPDSSGVFEELFVDGEEAYDLVISLGQDSGSGILSARPPDTEIALCALDYEGPQPDPGDPVACLVRYRVEEGSYACGYLAGWLTGRADHPLTNTIPLVSFIGARSDPLMVYYDIGFARGVTSGMGKEGTHAYYLETADDSAQARAYAEEAVNKGSDIIFCTPGPFNEEVIKVAEEKNILVILVGYDRSAESPDHVLTSLLLRDDNAVFGAVQAAIGGELEMGNQIWGIDMGTWSLAPFHGHDPYMRKEIKEKLREEQESVSGIDFS
jgi:basic membrane lipoprotein Med (substrate-binding protein (PBP1-ABC) superfamily)